MVGNANAAGRSSGLVPLRSDADHNAAVATFTHTKGITHCPTACVGTTQATIDPIDREALQRRWREAETRRLLQAVAAA